MHPPDPPDPSDDRPVRVRAGDAATLAAAHAVLGGTARRRGPARLLPFLGPAFVASVAYIDPGNFATNIQAGSKFGFLLLWVIAASNLMAMLVQTLSAKLGIATGRNLAELCREQFPRPVVWGMWVLMEVVAMATDLAEFVGAAVGFNLLFGLPLFPAALLTGAVTFLILAVERRGFRPLEVVITAFVGVIAACYLIELWLEPPALLAVVHSLTRPRFDGTESVLLAAGILGATVMPHAVFLHSSLTQHRIVVGRPEHLRRLYRFEVADVLIAMSLAGLVNGAMLIMAGTTFFAQGLIHVGTLEEAHRTLIPLLGGLSGAVFAVALLASGLSSSTVGTMSGQVIMQGFLHRRIPVWIRRLVTMLPALVVIGAGWDPTRSLVISQVVLSFGLPFALVPLVLFTSRRDLMGDLTNHRLTTLAAVVVTALIIALNVFLLYQVVVGA
ncbi:MAG: Nramp family divalent metal transporter [Armatimonadota bacterium]|nr:Nramp family divalent metal transporter [Armatimonadota bacterium]